HHRDAPGIDARMGSELGQGSKSIVRHRNRVELRLVGISGDDAAAGEGVEDEGCDADRVQLLRPSIGGRRNTAAPVDQDHGREGPCGSFGQPSLATENDRLSVTIAGEKLLVRYRDRGDRVYLHPSNTLRGGGRSTASRNQSSAHRGRKSRQPTHEPLLRV